MSATGDLGGRRGHAFTIEIKPNLLPVRCPTFLNGVCLLGGGDTESSKGQDHGANTDVGLRAFANMPTPRTLKNWGTDVSLGSNLLKLRVQLIAQQLLEIQPANGASRLPQITQDTYAQE